MTTIKVLLDTDIGTDIDDAVCLAHLLANPNCDLLGITTVSGEAHQRARLASALCHVAGKPDLPIYPGAESALLKPQRQTLAQQATALPRWKHQTQFPQGEAIDFLRRTIRAHPGEIALLTIGQLTNIALLFKADPEIPSLLKSLVMMCGVFTTNFPGCPVTEWNALLDPHAAAIVYQQPVAVHRSIGLDVTLQVTMDKSEVERRFQTDLLRPVVDFAETWFAHTPRITFHDPLAAVTLFHDEVCSFVRGDVEIELLSPRVDGMTHWKHNPHGAHEVALGVLPEAFFTQYFSVF